MLKEIIFNLNRTVKISSFGLGGSDCDTVFIVGTCADDATKVCVKVWRNCTPVPYRLLHISGLLDTEVVQCDYSSYAHSLCLIRSS